MPGFEQTGKKGENCVSTKREQWVPMTLTHLGDVGTLLQGGGGKLSLTGGDPGDLRKPSGGE